jgi:hypothetical protein
VLRTLNNSIRTLLLHASIPPSYWAEALATACYLLNRRPCSSINNDVPFTRLHGKPPQYDHLRVFGCLCYPNLQATSAHKLAARSTACVFLGYPSSHKGYRCLDLSSRRIIISHHVVFDESTFPFTSTDSITNSSVFEFLLDVDEDTVHCSTNPAAIHSCGHPLARWLLRPLRMLSDRFLHRPLRLLPRPLRTSSGRHLRPRVLRHTVVVLCPRLAPTSSFCVLVGVALCPRQ